MGLYWTLSCNDTGNLETSTFSSEYAITGGMADR